MKNRKMGKLVVLALLYRKNHRLFIRESVSYVFIQKFFVDYFANSNLLIFLKKKQFKENEIGKNVF